MAYSILSIISKSKSTSQFYRTKIFQIKIFSNSIFNLIQNKKIEWRIYIISDSKNLQYLCTMQVEYCQFQSKTVQLCLAFSFDFAQSTFLIPFEEDTSNS